MGALLFSVVILLLVGLSPVFGRDLDRRPEGRRDTAIFQLDNLKLILHQVESRNRQLQSQLSEFIGERTRNNKLHSELMEIKKRLEKIEIDAVKCGCLTITTSQVSNISDARVIKFEKDLHQEKGIRQQMENRMEFLEKAQENYEIQLTNLDEMILGLQANLSQTPSLCQDKGEKGVGQNRMELSEITAKMLGNDEKLTNAILSKNNDRVRENKDRSTKIKDQLTHVTPRDDDITPETFDRVQENRDKIPEIIDKLSGTIEAKNTEEEIAPEACSSPRKFVKLRTGCYFFRKRKRRFSYDSAKRECERMNASLVSVETVAERDTIQEYLQTQHHFMKDNIFNGFLTSGRRTRSNDWVWILNEKERPIIHPDVLANWATDEPGGQYCLSFRVKENYKWSDVHCEEYLRQFVCEM